MGIKELKKRIDQQVDRLSSMRAEIPADLPETDSHMRTAIVELREVSKRLGKLLVDPTL